MDFQDFIVNEFFHFREIVFRKGGDENSGVLAFGHPGFFPFVEGNIFSGRRCEVVFFFFLLGECIYFIENHYHRFLMRIDLH